MEKLPVFSDREGLSIRNARAVAGQIRRSWPSLARVASPVIEVTFDYDNVSKLSRNLTLPQAEMLRDQLSEALDLLKGRNHEF